MFDFGIVDYSRCHESCRDYYPYVFWVIRFRNGASAVCYPHGPGGVHRFVPVIL